MYGETVPCKNLIEVLTYFTDRRSYFRYKWYPFN